MIERAPPHVTEPSGARICLAFEIVPFDRNEQRWAEAERVPISLN